MTINNLFHAIKSLFTSQTKYKLLLLYYFYKYLELHDIPIDGSLFYGCCLADRLPFGKANIKYFRIKMIFYLRI